MLEYLSEWMKQIAYYMVLATVVMQFPAGKSYQKYIRMFTGIVLVLFVLAPIVNLASLDISEMMDSALVQCEEEMLEIEMQLEEAPEENGSEQIEGNSEAGTIEVEEIRIGQ